MKKRLCISWKREMGVRPVRLVNLVRPTRLVGSAHQSRQVGLVRLVRPVGLVVAVGLIGGAIAGALGGAEASALSFSQATDVTFGVNPTLSIDVSSADLVISELTPGTAADSNAITVSVSTNATYGYTLSATVGNEQTYTTTSLVRSDEDTSEFASVATSASLGALATDNSWGFSYKGTGEGATWANYSGLPLYSDTQSIKTLIDTSALDTASQSIEFKIAAKAAAGMSAGEYRNVVNFVAVAKPQPTPTPIACSANTICYAKNSLGTVDGTMANQGASANAVVTLRASNFSREGYGFAGWNTALDYSGTTYGPNETITVPADMSNGLALYAVWVKPSGTLQDWGGCVTLNRGDVTALTDARDNQTYAVAKLADGNCWMIENLRLEAEYTRTESEKNLSQSYGTNFFGLANAEAPWMLDSTDANSLYTTESNIEGKHTISGSYLNRRFPRYNNYNTQNRDNNSTGANMNTYSYGNYYTWPAAIADTNEHNTGNDNTIATSICPKGWRLPRGGNKLNEANNEYWNLVVNSLNNGIKPDNYDADNYPYYTGTPEGVEVSKLVRHYPNNFVYSGYVSEGSINYRGSGGYYWSSTPSGANYAYRLYLYSGTVTPGTNANYKAYGFSVRCLVAGS